MQNQYVADSLPIWSASYTDPAVVKKAGKQLVSVAKTQLPNMILRPQVTNYNAASQALQVADPGRAAGQEVARRTRSTRRAPRSAPAGRRRDPSAGPRMIRP